MSAPLLSLRLHVRGGTSWAGNRLRRATSRRTLQRQLCVGGGFSRADGRTRSGPDSSRASTWRQPPPVPLSRLLSAVAASSSSSAAPALFGDTIIVTKRCAERLNELREAKAQPALKLRLSVEGGGCSGFQYKFSLEDSDVGAAASEEDYDEDSDDEDEDDIDHEFERDGAVLVVDSTSLEFVKGATVDFEEDMMRSAFAVLNNPVSESACGCGSSFALKNFEKNPALD